MGKIVNAVGLKGEVKVYHYTDYKERFEEFKKLFIENVCFSISAVRYVKDMVILKLEGIDNRTRAEELKDRDVYIDKSDLRKLPEDTYHIFDLIGLKVVDDHGCTIGTVTDVIQNSAQDLYEIEKEDKNKFLIPAVEEFIFAIDLSEKIMRVKLIEGLTNL